MFPIFRCANIESLECVKYEPKARKRKLPLEGEFSEDDQYNEFTKDDVDPKDLTLQRKLIALVKEHNVLYDRCKVRDSKNLAAKNEAWRVISNALDVTEEFCYNKWKKMRDRFSREYRQYQLHPHKQVQWIYFQDLIFLESHYRKGKPLRLASSKSNTTSVGTPTSEDAWRSELSKPPYEYIGDENQLIAEDCNSDLPDLPDKSIEEYLSINSKEETVKDNIVTQTKYFNDSQAYHTQATTTSMHNDAEEKLSNLITNMECVVKQSHECLKTLQHQKQRFRQEGLLEQSHTKTSWQADVMRKIDTLLNGLSLEQRENAERKILQFLCECQIRTLNNENIEDVIPIQI